MDVIESPSVIYAYAFSGVFEIGTSLPTYSQYKWKSSVISETGDSSGNTGQGKLSSGTLSIYNRQKG